MPEQVGFFFVKSQTFDPCSTPYIHIAAFFRFPGEVLI